MALLTFEADDGHRVRYVTATVDVPKIPSNPEFRRIFDTSMIDQHVRPLSNAPDTLDATRTECLESSSRCRAVLQEAIRKRPADVDPELGNRHRPVAHLAARAYANQCRIRAC